MEIEQTAASSNVQQGKGLSWIATIIVAIVCLFVSSFWVRAIPIFADMFKGLNVELPLPTRILLANYKWLLPVLFVGSAAIVIAKEFFIRDLRRRLAATVVVFVTAGAFATAVYFLLNLPVFDLVQKLNQAK